MYEPTIKPLISIIVANYNYGHLLNERLDSLFSQTFEDFEVIFIDDCSTDNSNQVVEFYAGRPNLRIISNVFNKGWIETSNDGAKLARGDFLLFANADDYSANQLLEVLHQAQVRNPGCAVYFSASTLVDVNGKEIGADFDYRERNFKSRLREGGRIPSSWAKSLLSRSCIIPNLSSAMIDREKFMLVGGFSKTYNVCSDWELFFNLSSTSDLFYVPQKLNFFRQHPMTIRNSQSRICLQFEVLSLVLKYRSMSGSSPFDRLSTSFYISTVVVELLRLSVLNKGLEFTKPLKMLLKSDKLAVTLLPLSFTFLFSMKVIRKFTVARGF